MSHSESTRIAWAQTFCNIPNEGRIGVEGFATRRPVSERVEVDREPTREVTLLGVVVSTHILLTRILHHILHPLLLLRHSFVSMFGAQMGTMRAVATVCRWFGGGKMVVEGKQTSHDSPMLMSETWEQLVSTHGPAGSPKSSQTCLGRCSATGTASTSGRRGRRRGGCLQCACSHRVQHESTASKLWITSPYTANINKNSPNFIDTHLAPHATLLKATF